MKGDFTRELHRPPNHYQQVRMQQGRVLVDAEWNEQAALTALRDQTMARDLLGACGGPAAGAAFAIRDADYVTNSVPGQPRSPAAFQTSLGDFWLSPGRYYVQGVQCSLERWETFRAQPDRAPVAINETFIEGQSYLVYLDVWPRHVTALDDPLLRESALGGPDTSTRVKTLCQVRVEKVNAVAGIDWGNVAQEWLTRLERRLRPADAIDTQVRRLPLLKPDLLATSTSGGTATIVTGSACKYPGGATDFLCEPAGAAGYTGLENQLYRVEIHDGGDKDAATYKWSRENGSVVARVSPTSGTDLRLTVDSLGPDENLGFKIGDWAEVINDEYELEGKPGLLAQIVNVVQADLGPQVAPRCFDWPQPQSPPLGRQGERQQCELKAGRARAGHRRRLPQPRGRVPQRRLLADSRARGHGDLAGWRHRVAGGGRGPPLPAACRHRASLLPHRRHQTLLRYFYGLR